MDNKVSFKGKFLISPKIRGKMYYRMNLPLRKERQLVDEFAMRTEKCGYDLELADYDPISKYSFFNLKKDDKILHSGLESFWGDVTNFTSENLLGIYKKLILKKDYDEQFVKLQNDYRLMKEYLIEMNDADRLKIEDANFTKKVARLNKKFEQLMSSKAFDDEMFT